MKPQAQITRITRTLVAAPGAEDPAAAATVQVGFDGILLFVNTNTEDGRTLAADGYSARDLPMPLMFQFEETGLGEHSGSRPVGAITSIGPIDGTTLPFSGTIDPSDDGMKAAAMIEAGTVNRVSADLAVMEYELVIPGLDEAEAQEVADMIDGEVEPSDLTDDTVIHEDETTIPQFTALRWQVMGATVVPFSAFEGAIITLVDAAQPITAAPSDPEDFGVAGMIAFFPTADQATALADDPGDQAADTMHVTLVALPEAPDADTTDALLTAWAGQVAPLSGVVTGVGVFAPGDNGTPVIALVDAAGLGETREGLTDALEQAGIGYALDHDFVPHLTLAYQEGDAVAALANDPAIGMPLTFDAVSLVIGDARTDYPLTGQGSGDEDSVDTPGAITASAAGMAPLTPPRDWFHVPEPDGVQLLTVTDDGQVYGHLAPWGACHTAGGCDVRPPDSDSGYGYFHTGSVRTAEGEDVQTGVLTIDAFHAGVQLAHSAAVDHYAHTGCGAADLRLSDGKYGVWCCGALRPDVSASAVRKLRGGGLSGDWRPVDGNRFKPELIGVLAVNSRGFPIKALVASAGGLPELSAVTGIGYGPWNQAPRYDVAPGIRLKVLGARARGGLAAMADLVR